MLQVGATEEEDWQEQFQLNAPWIRTGSVNQRTPDDMKTAVNLRADKFSAFLHHITVISWPP
jgi:hypothetical protein